MTFEEVYSSNLNPEKIIPGKEIILHIDDKNEEILNYKILNHRWFKYRSLSGIFHCPSFHVKIISEESWNKSLNECETLEDFYVYCTKVNIEFELPKYDDRLVGFVFWEISYERFKKLFENNKDFHLSLVTRDSNSKILLEDTQHKLIIKKMTEKLIDWSAKFVGIHNGISTFKFTYGKSNKLLEKI